MALSIQSHNFHNVKKIAFLPIQHLAADSYSRQIIITLRGSEETEIVVEIICFAAALEAVSPELNPKEAYWIGEVRKNG